MRRARNQSAKDDRKQAILDAAELIIREQGLPSLSIASVARKTQLAVGTIYLYFEKKEDIIAQLTIKSREILLHLFRESILDPQDDALQQIGKILLAYFHFYRDHPFYHQLVSFYETNAGLAEPEGLRQASQAITDLVAGVVQRGKQQGHIRHDVDEQEFAFLLWGTAVGIIQLLDMKAPLLQQSIGKGPDQFYLSYIHLIINSLI